MGFIAYQDDDFKRSGLDWFTLHQREMLAWFKRLKESVIRPKKPLGPSQQVPEMGLPDGDIPNLQGLPRATRILLAKYYAKNNGLEVVDMTPSRGCLWIVDNPSVQAAT